MLRLRETPDFDPQFCPKKNNRHLEFGQKTTRTATEYHRNHCTSV